MTSDLGTNKQAGEIAIGRRIINHLDDALHLLDDPTIFGSLPFKEVEAIVNSVQRARMATANALHSLGDTQYREYMGTMPRVDILKRNENKWSEFTK